MNIVLSLGQLPNPNCWTGPQQFGLDLVAAMSAVMSGSFNGINFGSTLPNPEDQDKPWFRTNPDGSPDRLYVFAGQWISRHPIPAGSRMNGIWDDTEANLWAYDGGDGKDPITNIPTAVSGAMWQRNFAFGADAGSPGGASCFRIPVGIGTNPIAYNTSPDTFPATSITIGDAPGGEERHILTSPTELPAHTHTFWGPIGDVGSTIGGDTASNYGAKETTDSTGLSGSHNNMPPYYPVIFARRTARQFFTLTP